MERSEKIYKYIYFFPKWKWWSGIVWKNYIYILSQVEKTLELPSLWKTMKEIRFDWIK